MTDFIKIGDNFVRKNKINLVGIEQSKYNKKTLIFIRIDKSEGKSIYVPCKTPLKAKQELNRIRKELGITNDNFPEIDLNKLPKSWKQKIVNAKNDNEIDKILKEYRKLKSSKQ